jgi:hypothetical protein
VRALAGLVEAFEPARYHGDDARVLTELFARAEKLCATGRALAAARVADTDSWHTSGERSAAEWLARVAGQTPAQAAGALHAARRLRTRPDVDAAARAGQLSEAQHAALSAAADAAPDKTGELLERAGTDSLVGLRDRSRQIRLAASGAEGESARYRRWHAQRSLRCWTDDQGAGRLSGQFTPDALAAIRAALAPFHHRAADTARHAGITERPDCHAADALVAMARAATIATPPGDHDDGRPQTAGGPLDRAGDAGPDGAGDDGPAGAGDTIAAGASHTSPDGASHTSPAGTGDDRPGPSGADPAPAVGPGGAQPAPTLAAGARPTRGAGPPSPGDPAGPPRSPGGGRRPAMVIVRIDHAALVRGWREADECCEIDGVGPVPVATVRAMMTDAFVASVITDGIDIRAVAHLGRTVTAAQRTALVARDQQCVVPGCHARDDLEIDHVQGWAATRVTTLDSLARLCHHHHALKTYEGWRLEGRPGNWSWHPPTNPATALMTATSGQPDHPLNHPPDQAQPDPPTPRQLQPHATPAHPPPLPTAPAAALPTASTPDLAGQARAPRRPAPAVTTLFDAVPP